MCAVWKCRSRTLAIVFLIVSASSANGQAWTQKQGHGFVQAGYVTGTASKQFAFDGNRKPYAEGVDESAFFERSIGFYGEYGVTRQNTLVLSLPYKRLVVRDATYRYQTSAWEALRIGWRRAVGPLTKGSRAVALNVAVQLPLRYSRNFLPAAGAGQVDLDFTLDYGRSFEVVPAYCQVALGYRYRTSGYAFSEAIPCQEGVDLDCTADRQPEFGNQWLLRAEVGIPWRDHLLLQGLTSAVLSQNAPETGFTASQPIPTESRYWKLGGGVMLFTKSGFGVNGQMFTTPYGRNAVASFDVMLAVFYRGRIAGRSPGGA